VSNGGNFNEEEAIGSFWTDTIYPTEFSKRGKYFNIMTEERREHERRIRAAAAFQQTFYELGMSATNISDMSFFINSYRLRPT